MNDAKFHEAIAVATNLKLDHEQAWIKCIHLLMEAHLAVAVDPGRAQSLAKQAADAEYDLTGDCQATGDLLDSLK